MAPLGNRVRGRGRSRSRFGSSAGGGARLLPGGRRTDPGYSPFAGRPRTGGNGNGGITAPPIGEGRPVSRARGRGRAGGATNPPRQKPAIGNVALPGPGGRQLESRVQSGKITQAQAQRTMQQRQTLKKAFGPEWRKHLMVGGKSFAQVRKQLAANPGDAKLAAINKRLLEGRRKALEEARKKNAGDGSGEAQE